MVAGNISSEVTTVACFEAGQGSGRSCEEGKILDGARRLPVGVLFLQEIMLTGQTGHLPNVLPGHSTTRHRKVDPGLHQFTISASLERVSIAHQHLSPPLLHPPLKNLSTSTAPTIQ